MSGETETKSPFPAEAFEPFRRALQDVGEAFRTMFGTLAKAYRRSHRHPTKAERKAAKRHKLLARRAERARLASQRPSRPLIHNGGKP